MKDHLRQSILSRRSLLKSAGTGAALAALGMPTVLRAQTKTLRAAHVEATASATHEGHLAFANAVREKTGGSVEIAVFPAGQLGGARDIYEGIRLGSIDITSTGVDFTITYAPVMLLAGIYYAFENDEHVDRVFAGPVTERLSQALMSGAGMRILAWGDLGWRQIFSSKRGIDSVSDFRGMKIRVPDTKIHIVPLSTLGAAPTPVAYAEVYSALQTGIVDGAEGFPAAILEQRFNEVSSHYSLTNHLYSAAHLVIGDAAFGRLQPNEQRALEEAALEAFAMQRTVSRERNAASLAEMLKSTSHTIHKPDLAEIRTAVEPAWDLLLADLGPEGKEIFDLIRKAA